MSVAPEAISKNELFVVPPLSALWSVKRAPLPTEVPAALLAG